MTSFVKRSVNRWFPIAPERSRLDGAINDAEIVLDHCEVDGQQTEWWWKCADQHLKQAREYLAAGNSQQGWVSLHAAARLLLLDPRHPEKLHLAAVELRREMERLSGRRAKTIADLICDGKGDLLLDIGTKPMQIVHAIAIRDDQFQTDYFKIQLRRRHLWRLFFLLVVGILAILALSSLGRLPPPFDNARLMGGVVLFGILGAVLSVARGLLRTDLSKKIPAQQIGAFVIWMRPAIGAAAALISFVFLNAKAIRLFDWDMTDPTVIFTVAAVSGFSERFIVGAIEKIGGDEGGDEDKDKGKGKNKDKDKDKDKDKNKDKDRDKNKIKDNEDKEKAE